MNKLNCTLVQDLLPAFTEDLVSEETKLEVGAHLDDCKECRETYLRMNKEITVETDVPEPGKKLLLYIYSVRLWYLVCPLLALTLLFYEAHRALYLYEGFLVLFSVVCLSSQFFAGLTAYGFSREQSRLQQEAEKRSIRKWGQFRISPLGLCLPALFTLLFLVVIPLIIGYIQYFS